MLERPRIEPVLQPPAADVAGAGAAVDLQALSIVAGSRCWKLHVDALVINADGSLLDAVSIATKVGGSSSSSDTMVHSVSCWQLSISVRAEGPSLGWK